MSFHEMLDSYVEAKRLEGVKPATVRTYRKCRAFWAKRFDETPSSEEIGEHVAFSLEGGAAPASLRLRVNFLRGALNHAGVERHYPNVKSGRKNPAALSTEDWQRLMEHADHRERVFLFFGRGAGLRHDEILHLQWRDVDLETGAVSVTAKPGWVPKSCHERVTYLPEQWLDEIRAFKAGRLAQGPTDWIFSSPSGKRLVTFTKQMAELFKAVGVHRPGLRPTHCLRHAYATEALRAGATIETVRMALGHASIETTQRYLHSTPREVAAASNAGAKELLL